MLKCMYNNSLKDRGKTQRTCQRAWNLCAGTIEYTTIQLAAYPIQLAAHTVRVLCDWILVNV